MNTLIAKVTQIKKSENINIVSFQSGQFSLRMMALEISSAMTVGTEVLLGVKATNIALAKELQGMLSLSNQLDVTLKHIETGVLLCRVIFEVEGAHWESIITRDSFHAMALGEGDRVKALFKSSELSILEIH